MDRICQVEVEYSAAFLVEKELKRKGDKVFVMRLGFNDEHNSTNRKMFILEGQGFQNESGGGCLCK